MTNAEKYLKDNVSVEELIKQLYEIQDNNYNTNMFNCKKFFEEEVIPTLTKDEKVILRNVKDAEKIGRTPTLGQLYIITKLGEAYEVYFNKMFGHLFQFIKNGEEYSIEELLKND